MNRIIFCLALFTVASLLFGVDAPPEPAGMTTLFNGKDLAGWDGDPRLWSVKDGVIRGETTDTVKAAGNTFLILKDKTFSDFELRLSFRCNATNNSGIQYRSKHITEGKVANKWVVRGYQHEIRNENKLPSVSGFIYDEGGKRGRLLAVGEKATWEPPTADEIKAFKDNKDPKKKEPAGKKVVTGELLNAEQFQKLMKLDDWNDVVIIAKGNTIKHYLNGVQLIEFTDNHPDLALKDGIIALQLHAGKPMWAEYKNIRIKDLKN